MRHLLGYIFCLLLCWGCHSTTSDSPSDKKDTLRPINSVKDTSGIDSFKYNWKDTLVYENNPDYLITKGRVGKIRLGESIESFKEKYKDFKIDTMDAWAYGIDGGGFGYEVKDKDERLLFVWAQKGSNTINGIHVVSPRYRTSSYIRPGMTVKALVRKRPNYKLILSLMAMNEIIEDKTLDADYVFESFNKKLIRIDNEDSMFTSVKRINPKSLYRRINQIMMLATDSLGNKKQIGF